MPQTSTEILYLTLTAGLTGLLWLPYILNRMREMGAWNALYNPQPDLTPQAGWANRMVNAHRNAIENLMVFAPLVVCVLMLGKSSDFSATVCALFFYSRVAHAVIYTLGIPVLRTIAFAIGFGCQASLFYLVITGI